MQPYFRARGGGSNIGAKMLELTFPTYRKTFIFDCGIGMKPKKGLEDNIYLPDLNNLNSKYEIWVFLTHGHQDHVGAAPKFHKMYPKAKFFATAPTFGLTEVMSQDAIKIRSGSSSELHYTEEDLQKFLNDCNVIRSSDWVNLGENFSVRFEPAGHIRGAATIILKTPFGSFADSGDINFYDTTTVKGASLKLKDQLRWIAVESTNGDITLPDPKSVIEELLQDILRVVKRGGNVLIPVFAVGRGPDVSLHIGRMLRKHQIPVWSGGLLRKVTETYCHYHWESDILFRNDWYKNRNGEKVFSLENENIRWLNMRNVSRHLSGQGKVVIVPNGMLEAGYSQVFLAAWAGNSQNAIFLPGYQAEKTLGRQLIELKDKEIINDTSPITHNSLSIKVLAEIKQYKISGHADGNQLTKWISNMNPQDGKSLDKIMIIHGDQNGQDGLRKKLLTLPNRPKEILVGTNNQIIEL